MSEQEQREVLKRAMECLEDWGSYASPYFREKWDLDGDIKWFADKLNALPKKSLAPGTKSC